MRIRPADIADLAAIARIVVAAYTKYIERIGKPPGPMLDDYAALIRAHAVWVTDDLSGLIVLLAEPDHLLLDNIAVDPALQGRGVGRALMRFAEAEARRRLGVAARVPLLLSLGFATGPKQLPLVLRALARLRDPAGNQVELNFREAA